MYNSGTLKVVRQHDHRQQRRRRRAVTNQKGTCYLSGSTISGNTSLQRRRDRQQNGGQLVVNGCTSMANSARGAGGGLYNGGTATLSDCTISGNTAREPGGRRVVRRLASAGRADDRPTARVSGNTSASTGGGVFNNGTATLTDCTIADNDADQARTVLDDGGGAEQFRHGDAGRSAPSAATPPAAPAAALQRRPRHQHHDPDRHHRRRQLAPPAAGPGQRRRRQRRDAPSPTLQPTRHRHERCTVGRRPQLDRDVADPGSGPAGD